MNEQQQKEIETTLNVVSKLLLDIQLQLSNLMYFLRKTEEERKVSNEH